MDIVGIDALPDALPPPVCAFACHLGIHKVVSIDIPEVVAVLLVLKEKPLVCARLRHVAGTQWGGKKYMNMKYLEAVSKGTSTAG